MFNEVLVDSAEEHRSSWIFPVLFTHLLHGNLFQIIKDNLVTGRSEVIADVNMIYQTTSQKSDVQGSTCGWARLKITELSSNKSELKADQVHRSEG